MENPFEIIEKKLDRITDLLEKLIPNQSVNNNKSEPEIMTIDEAAAFIHIAKPTIYGYTSQRKIPHFKRGKQLYFKRDDLLNWLQEGKIKTINEIKSEADAYLLNRRRKSR